ncbi:hypothetical protein OG267_04400 [Kitasatospora herbaricolor]|uniref:hypothetical protein n=1 Tax=Kitasatospora herbaricolor TaxID=68217 RepID=UPI002E36B9EA|nr:hypothetical protein [Kitasatospora herbaricolor]
MPGPNASPTTYAAPAYTPEREQLISSLRQFIRTRGPDYLQDPNISSVGVGYRTNGTPEAQEIALQFTVDKKVGPEDLEALGTTAVPESVTVDGVEVPTQVIERTFAPDFRVVAETESPVRKQRLDPVVPGASVGNTRQATGTIGLLVFDRADGTPYVLSNWHVLHGPGASWASPRCNRVPATTTGSPRTSSARWSAPTWAWPATARWPPSRTAASTPRSSNSASRRPRWATRNSATR